jgi:hypothetical protein
MRRLYCEEVILREGLGLGMAAWHVVCVKPTRWKYFFFFLLFLVPFYIPTILDRRYTWMSNPVRQREC